MQFLSKLAQFFYRSPGETEKINSPRDRLIKKILIIFITSLNIYTAFHFFYKSFNHWQTAEVQIPLKKESWNVLLYSDIEACGYKNCVAEEKNQTSLKKLSLVRNQEAQEAILKHGKKEFWISVTIPVKEMHEAVKINANHFYLQRIRGIYEIFMDGQLLIKGNKGNLIPLSLDIAKNRLEENRPIILAIKIFNEYLTKDAASLNGTRGEGFVDKEHLERLSLFFLNKYIIRPLVMFTIYAILSLSFAVFWWLSARPEIFYFAWLNFICMAIQLRSSIIFYANFDLDHLRFISLNLRFHEGMAVLLFALSLARVPRKLQGSLFAFSLLGPLFFAFKMHAPTLINIEFFIAKWIIPGSFFTGSLLTLIQAKFNFKSSMSAGYHNPSRARQLFAYSLILFSMGVLYSSFFSWKIGIYDNDMNIFSYRSIQLLLTVGLVFVLSKEYKISEQLLKKVPVSSFHKKPILPLKVSGLIVAIDLKNSESLYKDRASKSASDNLVSSWRNLVYQSLTQNGATIINQQGDEVVAIFTDELAAKNHSLWNSFYSAMEHFELHIDELRRECRLRHINDQLTHFPFHYRCAVTLGQIQPIWEQTGDIRIPAWEEAGNSTPLVDIHRYLDAEKNIDGTKENSIIIMPTDQLSMALTECLELKQHILFKDQVVKGKHEVLYNLSGIKLAKDNLEKKNSVIGIHKIV